QLSHHLKPLPALQEAGAFAQSEAFGRTEERSRSFYAAEPTSWSIQNNVEQQKQTSHEPRITSLVAHEDEVAVDPGSARDTHNRSQSLFDHHNIAPLRMSDEVERITGFSGSQSPDETLYKHNRTTFHTDSYSSVRSSKQVDTDGSETNGNARNAAIEESPQGSGGTPEGTRQNSQGSGETSQNSSQSSGVDSHTSMQFNNRPQSPNRSAHLIEGSRRSRLRRRYTSVSGVDDIGKRDGLNRSTSINYTSNIPRTLLRQSSYMSTSRRMTSNPSGAESNASLTQERSISQRGSKVRVIYTDHSLRASQSSHPDSPSTSIPLEDTPLEDRSGDETVEFITKPWPEIGVTIDAIESPSGKVLRRSLSEVAQEGTEPQAPESIRFSLSSNCVANICSQHHAFLNAYELCEQHSFTDSRDLLCNVDFLCRLNFAAHRITEDIADEAERDLRLHFRTQSNPRARYFTDSSLTRHSTSVSTSFDDDQNNGYASN
ncbi:hypothetical protein OSTOST_06124, partial [Ostertagia ostertagi]